MIREANRFRHDEALQESKRKVQAIEAQYSSLFASRAGVEVLAHMMGTLGLFEPIDHDDKVVHHNMAIEWLKWAKIIKTGKDGRTTNTMQLVSALLTIGKE